MNSLRKVSLSPELASKSGIEPPYEPKHIKVRHGTTIICRFCKNGGGTLEKYIEIQGKQYYCHRQCKNA